MRVLSLLTAVPGLVRALALHPAGTLLIPVFPRNFSIHQFEGEPCRVDCGAKWSNVEDVRG
jgi:hypothetical protein